MLELLEHTKGGIEESLLRELLPKAELTETKDGKLL